jgi:hypothetical protein
MSTLRSEVNAFEKERLQKLSEEKNTTVLTPDHDFKHTAWKAERLRPLLERIATRVTTEFSEGDDDFHVRKTCLDDPETLAFQREHPKLYWMLTDRAMVKDGRFQEALGGMLSVREKVDSGQVCEGQEADALATTSVVSALHNGQRHI